MSKKNRSPLHQYDPQDLLDDEFDVDEFVENMSGHDYRRQARHKANASARRRIEQSREERWLREQIDDTY